MVYIENSVILYVLNILVNCADETINNLYSHLVNISFIDSDFVHYVMEAIMADSGILMAEERSHLDQLSEIIL